MRIHPWARQGFGRGAESYRLGRPGYPPEAVSWLAERTALGPGSKVVDLGAGTGNFTRLLADTGANVVAVEPLAEMRRRFPSDVRAEVVDGSAEEISLPNNSADLVTVAEAFHWFRGDEALREIHRVLRPGGSLGLVWNRLDLTNPFEAAFHALLERYRGHAPVRDTGSWRQAFERTMLFAPPELRRFENTQELDADALLHRAASESAIAILPEHRRGGVLAEVRALGRSRPEPIILQYVTEVYLYARLAEYKSAPPPGTFRPSRRKERR